MKKLIFLIFVHFCWILNTLFGTSYTIKVGTAHVFARLSVAYRLKIFLENEQNKIGLLAKLTFISRGILFEPTLKEYVTVRTRFDGRE